MPTESIQLNDLFWTLQGEGRFTGKRALFVRLPYCNYDCPWCDTEFDSHKNWNENEFLDFAQQEPARFAVITGGEPLLHKHLPRIISLLKSLNFYIACETNGSAPPPPGIDFITTSPKSYTKGKLAPYYAHPEILLKTNEWKYVVDQDFDFEILKRHKSPSGTQQFSLSPEFNDMETNTQRIIEFIKENPQWQLSLQTHKWINIP